MIENFVTIVFITILFSALYSVGLDLTGYSARQDEWEKAHPGETYIRGYRKLKRKGKI